MQEFSRVEQIIINELNKRDKVTKERLMLLTGLSKRRVRDKITKLKQKNVPIISSSTEKGYWFPLNEKECKMYVSENLHRANEIRKSCMGVMSDEAKKYYKNNRSKRRN